MPSVQRNKILVAACLVAALILMGGFCASAFAQNQNTNRDPTNVTVIVKEADTDEPVSQAGVTPGIYRACLFGHGKKHSYNAKADAQGRCKLFGINKGSLF